MSLTQNGTDGRVYGGDPNLIHVKDGTRAELGGQVAEDVDIHIRERAFEDGTRTYAEAYGTPVMEALNLCPGCYMVVLFNAAVHLAKENGQRLSELGNSMSHAFKTLAEGGEETREEIEVFLDPCEV